ncbi:hypothetical protein AA984_19405 [Brevibacillus formosus]|uniref:Uncharacterized protein n=1 Tax=Brevibacillus formosus TaxID=54913 RepID=A0A837KJK5_9BACL|nr:hypothetical protein [Brevibacillus formosus]KLH97315.1 hypothetical protein AA984_19405 [Brevibacillus formosus]MED1958368.1 hypothetical protein [Brevibacillus formosus]
METNSSLQASAFIRQWILQSKIAYTFSVKDKKSQTTTALPPDSIDCSEALWQHEQSFHLLLNKKDDPEHSEVVRVLFPCVSYFFTEGMTPSGIGHTYV